MAAAGATGRVVTTEDHSIIGGLGGAVAETLGEHRPTAAAPRGLRDVFGESAAERGAAGEVWPHAAPSGGLRPRLHGRVHPCIILDTLRLHKLAEEKRRESDTVRFAAALAAIHPAQRCAARHIALIVRKDMRQMKLVSGKTARGIAAAGLLCGTLAGMNSTALAHHAQATYTIGIANNVIGNGWREEMICAAKVRGIDQQDPGQGDRAGEPAADRPDDQPDPQHDLAGCQRADHRPAGCDQPQRGDPPGHPDRGSRWWWWTSWSPRPMPTRWRTTRSPTAAWAWSGWPRSWAARATWCCCRASPAPPPTPIATPGSSRRWPSTPASRWWPSPTPAGSSPTGATQMTTLLNSGTEDRRRLDLRHRLHGGQCLHDRRQALRACGGCRQQRLRAAARQPHVQGLRSARQ